MSASCDAIERSSCGNKTNERLETVKSNIRYIRVELELVSILLQLKNRSDDHYLQSIWILKGALTHFLRSENLFSLKKEMRTILNFSKELFLFAKVKSNPELHMAAHELREMILNIPHNVIGDLRTFYETMVAKPAEEGRCNLNKSDLNRMTNSFPSVPVAVGKKDLIQLCTKKYHMIQPSSAYEDSISKVYIKLQNMLQQKFKNSKLYVFGSSAGGLALKKSDVDMTLDVPDYNLVMQALYQKKKLHQERLQFIQREHWNDIILLHRCNALQEYMNKLHRERRKLMLGLQKTEEERIRLKELLNKLKLADGTGNDATRERRERREIAGQLKTNAKVFEQRQNELEDNTEFEAVKMIELELNNEAKAIPNLKYVKAEMDKIMRDIACIERSIKNEKGLHKEIFKYLKKSFRNVKGILSARVPVITVVDHIDCQISVDIVVNNHAAVHNTRLLKTYSQFDIRCHKLIFLVKSWAKMNGLNDASCGTLSSYALCVMAIHYLQVVGILPNLQGAEARRITLSSPDYSPAVNFRRESDRAIKKQKNRSTSLNPVQEVSSDIFERSKSASPIRKVKNNAHHDYGSFGAGLSGGEVLKDGTLSPYLCDNLDVTFLEDLCAARTLARSAHITAYDHGKSLDIADLFIGFFHYYAFVFDHLNHVVTIHLDPILLPRLKNGLWKAGQIWRISIEDPFQTAESANPHDLAASVQSAAQARIFAAFRQTYSELSTFEPQKWCQVLNEKLERKHNDSSNVKLHAPEKPVKSSKPQKRRSRGLNNKLQKLVIAPKIMDGELKEDKTNQMLGAERNDYQERARLRMTQKRQKTRGNLRKRNTPEK